MRGRRQLDAAQECLVEALSLARRLRSRRDIALTLGDIAETQFAAGQTFRYIAQPHFKTGALVPLLKNWGRPRHPVHIMYPPNRHLNAKVRLFVDWAVEAFAI